MALDDILTAIRVVAAGDAMIAREVLKLVGLGRSNAEIAAALYITPGTAKTHVAHLLAKLDAGDRAQPVITAYQAGLTGS